MASHACVQKTPPVRQRPIVTTGLESGKTPVISLVRIPFKVDLLKNRTDRRNESRYRIHIPLKQCCDFLLDKLHNLVRPPPPSIA